MRNERWGMHAVATYIASQLPARSSRAGHWAVRGVVAWLIVMTVWGFARSLS